VVVFYIYILFISYIKYTLKIAVGAILKLKVQTYNSSDTNQDTFTVRVPDWSHLCVIYYMLGVQRIMLKILNMSLMTTHSETCRAHIHPVLLRAFGTYPDISVPNERETSVHALIAMTIIVHHPCAVHRAVTVTATVVIEHITGNTRRSRTGRLQHRLRFRHKGWIRGERRLLGNHRGE
jgi:hypothetical protein